MDIMNAGAKWMNDQRNKFSTITVTYRFGNKSAATDGHEIIIQATSGSKLFKKEGDSGSVLYERSVDFIINTADLTFEGNKVEPKKGDYIIELYEGEKLMYDVSAVNGEQTWEYCGAGRYAYRIHTSYDGKEEVVN